MYVFIDWVGIGCQIGVKVCDGGTMGVKVATWVVCVTASGDCYQLFTTSAPSLFKQDVDNNSTFLLSPQHVAVTN